MFDAIKKYTGFDAKTKDETKTAGLPIGEYYTSLTGLFGGHDNFLSACWQYNGINWYKNYGYRFLMKVVSADSKVQWFHYTLPIPPTTYVTKPIMPNQVTPTLGGVVEESSPVKLWNISLEGVFTNAGARSEDERTKREKMATEFRNTLTTTGVLDGVFAKAQAAVSKVLNPIDRVMTAVEDFNKSDSVWGAVGAAASGVKDVIEGVMVPNLPYAGSAIDMDSNGMTEALEIQKFFLVYQAAKSKKPQDISLWFADIKTDQMWQVALRDITFQKNAQNPFLYRYSIILQGWNSASFISTLKKDGKDINIDKLEFDRMGPSGDLKSVNTMDMAKAGDKFDAVKKNLKKWKI